MHRVLFVCTGNTCRSPMAEGLFRLLAEREGLSVEVRSAGVSAMNGGPVSEHSTRILIEYGAMPPSASSMLTGQLADWSDLILTMTTAHKRLVIERHPHLVDKVYTLKEYVEGDSTGLDAISQLETLVSELQLKQALGQAITEDDMRKLDELKRRIPDFDISDPYGGTLELYRHCAKEIEAGLSKLVLKLKKNQADRNA
jgi:protein arginine phosphatase